MKKVSSIFPLVFVLAISFLNVKFAFAANLLTDPGFDNGVNDWSTIGHPFSAIDATFHTGPYSATNTITTVTEQDYYGQIYQIVQPFSFGEPVYLSAWLKTNFAQGSTARAGILVEFLDVNNSVIPNSAIKTEMAGINDWKQVYVTGNAPAGTAKIRAGTFIYAAKGDVVAVGGVVYVDDCFLDKAQAPGDLITNPGLESLLSGWTTGAGTYPFNYTAGEKHSGTYSAYDSVDSVTAGDYFSFIYQEFNYTPATPVYASAWGKSDINELAQAKAGLIIQFLNSGGNVISELKSQIGGKTDWRQLYVSGSAPTGTTKIRAGAFIYAAQGDNPAVNGKFYVDDFVASTSYLPPPPPSSNLINPGFENGVNDWNWPYRPFTATSVHHSGNFAALHNIGNTNDDTNDYFAEIYQEFSFSAGQTAYTTGWLKTAIDPAKNAKAGLQIQFFNSSGNPLLPTPAKSEIGGNTDWKLLYAYSQAPAGTVKVRISGYAWALKNQGTINGNAYIDDVTFSNTAPSELIFNPGFEDVLSGWTIDGAGFPVESTNQEHHSGAYSAKSTIVIPSPLKDFWSRVYQEFSFGSGETIYATLWAKTDINPTSNATAGIKAEFINNSDQVLKSIQDVIRNIAGWSYLYVSDVAPAGTVKVRISPFISCPSVDVALGGSAYFDDVVASRSPLPLPNFPTEISNNGFESGLINWFDLYGLPSDLVSDPNTGAYSLKKTIGETHDLDYYSTTYQDIYSNNQGAPFSVDKNVYVTSFVKSNINPAANVKAGIRLEYFDTLEVSHEIAKDEISAFNNWRQLYLAGIIPAGAKRVRLSGFTWAKQGDAFAKGGTVNFDDLIYSYTEISVPALPTQLLNTGFENGINDWDNIGNLASVVNSPVHSGNLATNFIIDDVSEDYFGDVQQEIAVSAGKIVKAKVWAKTLIDPLAAVKASLRVEFRDVGNNPVGSVLNAQIGGNQDWKELVVSGTAPVGATKLIFIASLYAAAGDNAAVGGQAYFDDASLSITSGNKPRRCCFVKGTKIKLANGRQISIEKVKVGDKVLGFKDGQSVEAKVLETFSHPKEKGYFIIRTESGKKIEVTTVHPISTPEGYKSVEELKAGDSIHVLKEGKLTVAKVSALIFQDKARDVYNLEVAGVHNYFANNYLVHNKDKPCYENPAK